MASNEAFQLERDVYRAVLGLRDRSDLQPALSELLGLVVRATNAERGYLELGGEGQRWLLSHGCTDEEHAEIRAATSRGIVTTALAAGKTLHVPLAMLDDRFAKQPSVQGQRLEAVLCVPIGGVGAGVLYLEGRRGNGPFTEAAIGLAEDVAQHIGPSVDAAARTAAAADDATRPYRARLRLDGIAGTSEAMARVFAQIEPFTKLTVTVLITGETGTGKTQLARAIHDNSTRHAGPFVAVNCGALPPTLIEAELFGTLPGAFTGAVRKPGLVEVAEGGTLFLDEIGEIPIATQSKLLQLIQFRQYFVLGSTRQATANVRFIAATNADLPALIEAKQFREDLYFRINVIEVRMPSLMERRGDIPILLETLIARLAEEHQLPAIPPSRQFRIAMENREWRGNVRELSNEVQRALILAAAEGARQIELRHLRSDDAEGEAATYQQATRRFQRDLVRRELEATDWNITEVADRLDLSRAHVYNLINQFGLSRK